MEAVKTKKYQFGKHITVEVKWDLRPKKIVLAILVVTIIVGGILWLN